MSYKTLIVEDDPSIAALYKQFLLIDGLESDIARNAAEAICKIDDIDYDIIILDICLPVKSGMFVVKYLEEKKKNPKIMVISAIPLICQPDYYAVKRAASVFLEKPVDYEELICSFRKLLPKK